MSSAPATVGQTAHGKLQSVEWRAVKVRAVPDENGRTFEDPKWIPTHEPIEDLGTLCFSDFRPWWAKAIDRVLGRSRKQIGNCSVAGG